MNKEPATSGALLTLSYAAQELAIAPNTLRRRADDGIVPCLRLIPSGARVFRVGDVIRAKVKQRTDR